MKRTLSVLVAAFAILVAPGVASARIIVGELQLRAGYQVDIDPPERLDVLMWRGNLDGKTYWTRCANMGGYIVFETWNGRSEPVCRDVDY